jgi:hypothetical protein
MSKTIQIKENDILNNQICNLKDTCLNKKCNQTNNLVKKELIWNAYYRTTKPLTQTIDILVCTKCHTIIKDFKSIDSKYHYWDLFDEICEVINDITQNILSKM